MLRHTRARPSGRRSAAGIRYPGRARLGRRLPRLRWRWTGVRPIAAPDRPRAPVLATDDAAEDGEEDLDATGEAPAVGRGRGAGPAVLAAARRGGARDRGRAGARRRRPVHGARRGQRGPLPRPGAAGGAELPQRRGRPDERRPGRHRVRRRRARGARGVAGHRRRPHAPERRGPDRCSCSCWSRT
jgi:hypothetical protein